MIFKPQKAPHISHNESTRTLMGNVILAMLVLYGMAYFYYGVRAIILGVVGVLTAILTDSLCLLLFKGDINVYDYSSVVTGMIIPLLLPASIPFHVPMFAVMFGLIVAKHPFGGTGHNVFNPAAAGYAFVLTSYPASVIFSYPMPKTKLPILALDQILTGPSTAFSLNVDGIPGYDKVGVLLGNVPGPMGATNILVLLACLAFLLLMKTIRWEIPVFFLGTTSVLSLLFPRVITGPIDSFFYEMTSGLLLFGAIFLLADPVTIPKRRLARIAYAIICGIIVMVYRHAGRLEEGFPFALLLMNCTVWGLDMLEEKRIAKVRRKQHGTLPSQEA